MSFSMQEQALFELLFDEDFRTEFAQDRHSALSLLGLNDQEIADFLPLRLDALQLEADARRRMILSQLTTHMPLSIALLSSFDNGFETIIGQLKAFIIRAQGFDRVALLTQQLLFIIDDFAFINAQDKQLLQSILDLERCFALQQVAMLKTLPTDCAKPSQDNLAQNKPAKNSLAEPKSTEFKTTAKPNLCDSAVLALSPLLEVNHLPLSYWQLKRSLCSVEPSLLWRELQHNPVLMEQRLNILASMTQDSSCCVISLPRLLAASATDPMFELHIIEMIEGFIPLLNRINQQRSSNDILQMFSSAGADDNTIRQARQGFQTLLDEGCIQQYEHEHEKQ